MFAFSFQVKRLVSTYMVSFLTSTYRMMVLDSIQNAISAKWHSALTEHLMWLQAIRLLLFNMFSKCRQYPECKYDLLRFFLLFVLKCFLQFDLETLNVDLGDCGALPFSFFFSLPCEISYRRVRLKNFSHLLQSNIINSYA